MAGDVTGPPWRLVSSPISFPVGEGGSAKPRRMGRGAKRRVRRSRSNAGARGPRATASAPRTGRKKSVPRPCAAPAGASRWSRSRQSPSRSSACASFSSRASNAAMISPLERPRTARMNGWPEPGPVGRRFNVEEAVALLGRGLREAADACSARLSGAIRATARRPARSRGGRRSARACGPARPHRDTRLNAAWRPWAAAVSGPRPRRGPPRDPGANASNTSPKAATKGASTGQRGRDASGRWLPRPVPGDVEAGGAPRAALSPARSRGSAPAPAARPGRPTSRQCKATDIILGAVSHPPGEERERVLR